MFFPLPCNPHNKLFQFSAITGSGIHILRISNCGRRCGKSHIFRSRSTSQQHSTNQHCKFGGASPCIGVGFIYHHPFQIRISNHSLVSPPKKHILQHRRVGEDNVCLFPREGSFCIPTIIRKYLFFFTSQCITSGTNVWVSFYFFNYFFLIIFFNSFRQIPIIYAEVQISTAKQLLKTLFLVFH